MITPGRRASTTTWRTTARWSSKPATRAFGRPGITYDAITYTGNVINSLYNVTGNTAVLNNGLAPWGGATATRAGRTSFTVPQLNATGAMLPFQTGVRRDLIGGNFKLSGTTGRSKVRSATSTKTARLEQSFYGPWGGTAFGMPVNYDTDRYDLSAAYTTHHLQALFQYTFSHFIDNVSFVNLPYPTSRHGGAIPAIGGLFDTAQQRRALSDVHGRNGRGAADPHQCERARRAGIAGRHVRSEHRRSLPVWRRSQLPQLPGPGHRRLLRRA